MSSKQAGEDFLQTLQKSEAALDHIARKLEEEFASRFEGMVGLNAPGTFTNAHHHQKCTPSPLQPSVTRSTRQTW